MGINGNKKIPSGRFCATLRYQPQGVPFLRYQKHSLSFQTPLPHKKRFNMASQKVNVVFDRKESFRERGQGISRNASHLSRRERKYIPNRGNVLRWIRWLSVIQRCKMRIKTLSWISISAMLLFNDEMTVQQFDGYYLGKRKSKSNNLYKGDRPSDKLLYLFEGEHG